MIASTNTHVCAYDSKGGSYDAPFFTTWFCTAWTSLFFPVYCALQCLHCSGKDQPTGGPLLEAVRHFRDRGFTFAQFTCRTLLLCLLWVATNYLLIRSLRALACTDVVALYSTHAAFVYLLSWVVLHEQFVGVRVRG
ncbi:putative thiamine transporter SLC35F3 [Amphibalanus amphitrite]|uniref:Putative thiamine transporter SLC35F3 n=1 Tax=Amphibalanus amphitrite TaxID=1232801 RepID=A0A6A4WTZ8_AMPAM|nr:putative thiamine transporter SLC35F3 [Amphibalanus amphitrite]